MSGRRQIQTLKFEIFSENRKTDAGGDDEPPPNLFQVEFQGCSLLNFNAAIHLLSV